MGFRPSSIALWLGLFPIGPALGDEPAPPPMGTISGRLVDPEGKPVAGASLWSESYDYAARTNRRLVEGRTDAEGRFRLGPVAPFYRNRGGLFVEAEGFAATSTPWFTLSAFPGRDNDLGTIRVDRGRVFTGRVVDSFARARPEATVEVTVHRHELGHTINNIGPTRTILTDGDGRFQTPPLPVGDLSIVASTPGSRRAYVGRKVIPGGEEDLGPILLEDDVPVVGTVRDEEGRPIAGVRIGGTSGHSATTDAEGRFELRGFGPDPSFQLNVSKEGYDSMIGLVKPSETGPSIFVARGDAKAIVQAGELAVTLKRLGRIEGRAVDAETGEPVPLGLVWAVPFERKADGEVVDLPAGGRITSEQPPGPDRFGLFAHSPGAFHLFLKAPGYRDAEAFTPPVDPTRPADGIVVKMERNRAKTPIPGVTLPISISRSTISGTVTRDGRRVESGWVGLWLVRRTSDAINAPVLRGRTVVGPPVPMAGGPIRDGVYSMAIGPIRDGVYSIDLATLPRAEFLVVAEEPGRVPTQVGPMSILAGQSKVVDVACVDGARISGRVEGVPAGWEGHGWVVAFNKTAVREEARISPDGTFTLPPLPPGEYGLKVGHDAYEDPETFPGKAVRDDPAAGAAMADPWKRAVVVKVEAGRPVEGVVVEWPR